MRLRSHLLALSLGTLVPMILFALVAAALFVDKERKTFEGGARERIHAILTAVDTELRGAVGVLQVLATSRHLDAGDLATFYADAAQVLRSRPDWVTINLAAPSGQQLLNLARPLGAELPSIGSLPSFAQALRTARPVIDDILFGPVTGQYDVAVRVPVVRQGVVKFVLSGVLKPDGIDRLLAAQRLPPDWVGVVMDRQHRIVARTLTLGVATGQLAPESAREALARASGGWHRGQSVEGRAVYISYARSPFSGWTVALSIPAKVVEAVERRTLAALATGLLAAVAVGALLAFGLGRRIAGPITALASAAKAVGRGGEARIPRPIPVDEVRELADALEDAADAVRAREATQAELAAIVDSSSDAIISFTPAGTVRTWNPAARRLFGYTAAEAIGRHVSFLVPPDRLPELTAILTDALSGGAVTARTVHARSDGTRIPVALTVSPVRDASGVVTGLSASVRDITDERRAEEERARLLASERIARQEAQAANQAKDEFLAMLGHELRNPLGAISIAARLLDRPAVAAESARQAREVILRQTEHLARLVDDLLDVGRVMTGKIVLDRRPLDLADSVERSVATFRAAGRVDQHLLHVEARPAWVDADGIRIEQVISNLLGNALKYTPAGGTIRVTVGPVGGAAVLEVEDSGVGIPPALLPRVFDLFVQGDQALDRSHGGLGIGLTLVRRLVELHGGTIEAWSAGPGQGSRFTVRLPLAPRPPAGPSEQIGFETHRLRRILVVEDSQDAREMMRQYLEMAGHTVFEADDGTVALQAVRELRPDVAIIDIGLPGLDGYAVARELRSMPEGKSLRLVAVTGYGMPEDRRRAREAGFDAHVVKPVDPDELARLLSV